MKVCFAERMNRPDLKAASLDFDQTAPPSRETTKTARRSVAAQIGDDDAASLSRKLGGHIYIEVNVVGEAVHQHHDRSVDRTGLEIGDVESAGVGLAKRFEPFRRRCARKARGMGFFTGNSMTAIPLS
jgi:hypothetical protein